MSDIAWLPRVLWAVIAVCLLGGLVAIPIVGDDDGAGKGDDRAGGWVGTAGSPTTSATTEPPECAANGGCGGGDAPDINGGDGGDGGDAGAPAPGATTATTTKQGAPGGSTATNGPASTDAPATTSPPTTAAAPEDLGPPGDPGPATVPSAGVYRYKLSDSRGERDTTTKIEDRPPTGAPERRQLVSYRGDELDLDSEVAWRGDGVHVLSTVISFGPNKGTCDWNPDMVELKLPLAKGTTWESSSTCNMTGVGPTPIPLNRKITGKLLEVRRIRVAGQIIDVWAIEATEHLDGGGRSSDSAGTTLFSPKHGVVVSSSGKRTTSDGPSDYRREIQNLSPE